MTELQPSLSGYRGQDEASIPPNGDENIYRYSESVEFDSFNLVHDDRDAESPPPTPPVRDASSLKSVCYGPGHEKCPSWPSSKGSEEKNAACNVALGSHRSKSWTDHTNYPKEKLVQYTRPLTKRPTPTFTQQLKTVMEKCEKIPAESFESRKTFDNSQQHREVRLWPRVDREGKSYGDAGYVVPSPPEREQHQPLQTLNHADFEAYIRNYPESQIECYNGTTLTQEGLDEYTRVEHTQQPSYAQSEGYHSYVSSVDSTTNTPFLDRLRRDSEAVAHRPGLSTWEDSSHEGRDSVVTTSSGGSASSSETLKWHGSMSDVSVSSGLQARRSDHWTHASISDVSSVDETLKKLNPNDCKCHSTINNRNGKPPKNTCLISQSPFVNDVSQMSKDCPEDRYFSRNETTSLTRSTSTRHPNRTDHKEDWSVLEDTDSDQAIPVHGASKQLIAHSSRVQTPQRHHSESILYLDKKRNQRKLHPISSPPSSHNPQTRSSPVGLQQNHPSVSDRVDELEKQQIRYTYLDPDKRHRVSDPTLKAIQKKALLSFYERHHQSSWRSEPHLVPGNVPQKSPPQPPFRSKLSSPRRASSASDYANSNWRNNNHQVKKSNPSDSLGPKHKHSNSCGSLSTALLGPVIVGTAISIDDWVPERPPKNPHLRTLYSDRIPSPDLPPPSPPPVTDNEVFNCDEPLPPPPAELHDGMSDLCRTNTQYEDKFHVNGSNYVRRSKYERKINSTDEGFTRGSLRQSDQGLIENYPNYRITAGRSSLRYPSRGVGGMIDGKLPSKMSDMSQQYAGNNHERVGPEGLLKSCSIRQLTKPNIKDLTGRTNRETSLTLGQKPQPQVSRNHSISINGQGKPYSTLSDIKNYKFSETSQNIENSPKSADDKKYDELSQYFPYYQQQNHYVSGVKSNDASAKISHSSSLSPPPLAPRQSIPGVKSMPPPRPAPPVQMFLRKSSKTSYAVNKHERHSPETKKTYKNTMVPPVSSPEWQTYQKCDNAVLRQITSHQQNTDNDSSQYHHVQTLNQRIEERINAHHDEILTGRLLNGSRKILQKSMNSTSENNNNNSIISTDDCHDKCLSRLSHLSDERENSRRNYKCERSALNGGEGFNGENSHVEQKENEPVMRKIEIFGDHRGQKLTNETPPSYVEFEGSDHRHWTAGSVSDVHSLESIESTHDTTTIKSSSLSTGSLHHSNSTDNNNEERSITMKRFSPQRPHEIIDYGESIDHNVRASYQGTDDGVVLSESPQSEVSSLDQKRNSWTKCQVEGISTNALRRIPSNSPLLSNNLKPSDASSSSVSSQCSPVEIQISPCVSPQPGIEELRLLQRTEVVLRINATLDAASQTEVIEAGENTDGNCERVIPEMRKKLQEEIECEELSKNLADQLGPHDKLVPILVPAAEHKKSTDYVSGLFRVEATLHPRLKSSISYSPGIDSEPEEEHKYSHQIMDGEAGDMNGQSSSCSSIEDSDLRQKKEELVLRLDRKVVVLRAEQEAVREEDETNEALGAKVATRFSAVARPAEFSKFRLHIEEVGKITSLLLGLSGRLARVENALHGMPSDHPEKKILESKRDKLLDQLEEAKILKTNIDKRSANVSAILSKYLNDEEFADYQHFINMKTKLIMDSRELQDKVKLGEEQLSALKEAIG